MTERVSPKFVLTEEGCLWIYYKHGAHSGWWWELRDPDDIVRAISDRGFETIESCAGDAFEHGCLAATVGDDAC